MAGVKGCKQGVRRSTARNGAIWVNGHPPISAATRAAVLAVMAATPYSMSPTEVARATRYSRDHMRNVLPYLVKDGDLVVDVPGVGPHPNRYCLPGRHQELITYLPTKRCPACTQTRGLDEFGTDRHAPDGLTAHCKPCRSDRAHEAYLRRLPAGATPRRRGRPARELAAA